MLPILHYVDDYFCAECEQCIQIAKECFARLVRACLGESSISDRKLEHGNPLTVLGIDMRLDVHGVTFWPSADKVQKWIQDIDELSEIAKDEPQLVYSSFTKAISHRWTYVQRTIPDINHYFEPLEEAIREKLIPAIIGRKVSDIERRIFALPVRYGGLGITNPTQSSENYKASSRITANLSRIIVNQESDFSNYNIDEVKKVIAAVKKEKEAKLEEEFQQICDHREVDESLRRMLELKRQKSVGCWLTALPVQSWGYTLNKQRFRDAIRLRYGWNFTNIPSHCMCGKKNDVDHLLICKKGPYVNMRHNRVRDLEAELMREVCHDVQVEPDLLPIEGDVSRSGNTAEKARLDVAGIGVWGSYQRTYLDIRITHPNAPSYVNKPIEDVYLIHENEKKNKYNERVIQIEKGSFTPIVGSTCGGWGIEAQRHHKRIATLIAEKKNESYADVISYIRTRLRFCVLDSVLTAVRGVRGKTRPGAPISTLDFNLIEH